MTRITKRDAFEYLAWRFESPYWSDDMRKLYPIHWNIKMHGSIDFEGLAFPDEFPNEARFNVKWAEWLEHNSIFFDVCESVLYALLPASEKIEPFFFEGTPLDGIPYTIYQVGRGGGHLVLDTFDNEPMWDSQYAQFEPLDLWMRERKVTWFRKLYAFCIEIDRFVDDRYRLVEMEYAFHRHELEQEWRAEEQDARELAAGQVGPMQVSPISDSVTGG